MGSFDVVELQRASDGVEDVVGHAADGAAFELDVVLGADPGEHRHLLAAEACDAASSGGAQPGLVGCDAGATGREEVADRVAVGHVSHGTSLPDR